MSAGFEIRVNGEVVWESDDKVLSVEASTARGAVADVKSEDLNFLDLVVTARSNFNRPLTVVDEEQLAGRREFLKKEKVKASVGAEGKSVVEKNDKKSDKK